MQIVELIGEDGRKLRYGLNDDDPAEEAMEIGIPIGVPDLSKIDWETVMVEISNRLYDAGLFSRDDLASVSGNKFNDIILLSLSRRIKLLYKE